MDLPVARIAKTNVRIVDGAIELVDGVYDDTLLGLHSTYVYSGCNVAVVREKNRFAIYRVASNYDYETMNRRIVMVKLREKLADAGIELVDFGLLYQKVDGWYVNGVPISMYIENNKRYCALKH